MLLCGGSSPLARGLPGTITPEQYEERIIPARAGFTYLRGTGGGAGRDHPRSRGVYARVLSHPVRVAGSSPLARGLQDGLEPVVAAARIIPARAGFTGWSRASRRGRTDHPRSRGVYTPPAAAVTMPWGSSPLARGLHDPAYCALLNAWIIPARAGFTTAGCAPAAARWDHPRSRGVYARCGTGPPSGRGSSPLARGLPQRRNRLAPSIWIIPARAGFTRDVEPAHQVGADHPRSRGVYPSGGTAWRPRSGSSPLARGLRLLPDDDHRHLGIIPARAGFTSSSGTTEGSRRDHPRSRGVYIVLWNDGGKPSGSSPLARGLHEWEAERPDANRIIPARAGFTTDKPIFGLDPEDHPRSRGVYGRKWTKDVHLTGSSPLARGLRAILRALTPPSRIIPARAGFTMDATMARRNTTDHPRSRGVYP